MPQGGRVGRSIAKSQGAFVTPIVTNNPVFQVKLIDVDDKLEQPAAQQKPMKDEVRRGEAVIGTALGKDNKKKHKGIVDNIIKDANGNVTSFTIVDEDGDQIKLDPTSVSRLDLHNDGKNKIAGDDFKVMEKSNKAMSFDAWLAESVNEATAADVSQADHWLKNHATKNPNAGDWNNPKYQSYDYELKDGNKVALMDRGVTIWKFTEKETTMPYRKWFKYVKDIYESVNEGKVDWDGIAKEVADKLKGGYWPWAIKKGVKNITPEDIGSVLIAGGYTTNSGIETNIGGIMDKVLALVKESVNEAKASDAREDLGYVSFLKEMSDLNAKDRQRAYQSAVTVLVDKGMTEKQAVGFLNSPHGKYMARFVTPANDFSYDAFLDKLDEYYNERMLKQLAKDFEKLG